jgi:translocation and assembly module TamB
MTRRRFIAVVSACVLFTLGLVVVATGLVVTRTGFGQERLRAWIQRQATGGIHGKIYLGAMSGGFLTGVTIDSVAIRDENDSLLLSTGRVTVAYDPRDLIDKRLLIRRLEVEHPVVNIRQAENGDWNFKRIFRADKRLTPKTPGRGFGDYVVVDSVRLVNGSFALTLPWHPDDSLHGAKLDSAIRYTLTSGDKEIRRAKGGFARTWRWTDGRAFVSHVRLADPDSDRLGQTFTVDKLDITENDPPFSFRNIRGGVKHLGDSLWVDITHFDLPGSTGDAKGKILWGSELPVRYDIAVRGDSVSLRDVGWVYPTLPTTGGGSTLLQIKNERDLRIIDYKLTRMDVRTTGSHVRGNMTFAVGGPILAVKDVRLDADPVDFELLRTFNGKPFPIDWRGQLTGYVRGPGGPLTRFVVDAADATWRDTHVAGAVSRFGGSGELDILNPAVTAFHHFAANVAALDLRSIEYLFPNFPRLGGILTGTATLDSSWLDLRFTDASAVHQDGPGDPSRVGGSGRVTWGEKYITYDVTLDARPLSLGMLARSYPKMPFTGLVSGPIRARGTAADLDLSASLQGPAGGFAFDGKVDIDPPGYAAHGNGQFANLDPRQLLGRPTIPAGSLNGRYDVQLTGDSLANLQGTASVSLGRSEIDSVRIYPSVVRLAFGDGKMRVDTLRIETIAATITAVGGLGLPHGVADSLTFAVNVDSVGGLRRFIGREASASRTGPDTLALARGLARRHDRRSGRGEGADRFVGRGGRSVWQPPLLSDRQRGRHGGHFRARESSPASRRCGAGAIGHVVARWRPHRHAWRSPARDRRRARDFRGERAEHERARGHRHGRGAAERVGIRPGARLGCRRRGQERLDARRPRAPDERQHGPGARLTGAAASEGWADSRARQRSGDRGGRGRCTRGQRSAGRLRDGRAASDDDRRHRVLGRSTHGNSCPSRDHRYVGCNGLSSGRDARRAPGLERDLS